MTPKITQCECDPDTPGELYCPRHKCMKGQPLRRMCAAREDFFQQGERNEMPQQHLLPEPKSVSTDCVHRGDRVGEVSCESCGGKRVDVFTFACALHGTCAIGREFDGVRCCVECRDRAEVQPRRIIIRNGMSPGDIAALTGAIKALHESHPGKFITDCRTSCHELWEHSGLSRGVPDDSDSVDATYEGIHRSDAQPIHFLQAFCDDLAKTLDIPRFSPANWLDPSILLSAEEKSWINAIEEITGEKKPFWIVNAGVKRDYTAKRWNGYQAVIDATRDKVTWVQVGSTEHDHSPLEGAINLLGQTDLRQLVRLVYHAEGVLCGVTALMHLAHWVERGPFNPHRRHAVVIAGGREPPSWFSYPGHHVLSTIGELDCCAGGACWKSRVVKLNDGQEQDGSLCAHPKGDVGSCMELITPEAVSQIVLRLASKPSPEQSTELSPDESSTDLPTASVMPSNSDVFSGTSKSTARKRRSMLRH